jgi:ketosteroid isomerase-like protein
MTENKKVVLKYVEGFEESDNEKILSCLTDDVVWIIPGMFHLSGKKEFNDEIENDNFVGSPTIEVNRLIEENNVVVSEGHVMADMTTGERLDAVFCDVFEFENGKIKKLVSHLMAIHIIEQGNTV